MAHILGGLPNRQCHELGLVKNEAQAGAKVRHIENRPKTKMATDAPGLLVVRQASASIAL